MDKVCCIDVSLMARIIGAYTMSLSILMLNLLMSYYFSRKGDEDFFESLENWSMLGINWMQTIRYMRLQKKAQVAVTCFLIYIFLFLLASTYLALGTITKRHKCAMPWMYLQFISIIDQTVALSFYITRNEQKSEKSMWYIPLSSIYLTLSIYFWLIVQTARMTWCEEQQSRVDNEPRISDTSPATSNTLKSPSYVSQNLSMLQMRGPMVLPK